MHVLRTTKGMSLVELLIAIALISLVFGGIMASFQIISSLVGSSKAYAGAASLANERIEFIRSLQYNDVGTIAGIPPGPIPQTGTTTINGREYKERVIIEFVDDAADGVGGDDDNGILADYKRVKVEYSWTEGGKTKVVSLITNIVPKGIETTAGGGTLVVNVFDAKVQPLAGAEVRIVNNTGSTTIDTIRYTNASGIAMFAGAPALANYEITVTGTGYSTDRTYSATSSNPEPSTTHVAVLESQVSTMNFQIDKLSDLRVATIGIPATGEYIEEFSNASSTEMLADTQVADDMVILASSAGAYVPSGQMRSIAYAPGDFDTWDALLADTQVPFGTSLIFQFYDASSSTNLALIPDSDLPGNAVGFTSNIIPLSLASAQYPALAVGVTFLTNDTATSSALLSWELAYTEDRPALPNVPFTFTGAKIIGTNGPSVPIYKYAEAFTTDADGEAQLNSLEWDSYTVAVTSSAYDVAEACENIPYMLEPGVSQTLTLTLAPAVSNSLRVRVEDVGGNAIPNADITLSRPGFVRSGDTSMCGQYFFNSGVSSDSDYTINVNASGYIDRTVTDVSVSGETAIVMILNAE